jgi:Fe-Mn family superoxide dismutase
MKLPKHKLFLPALSYEYDGLEPITSARALRIHHLKHHQSYVKNYNKLLGEGGSKSDMEFNYSGHILHTHLWESFTPHSNSPSPKTLKLLTQTYGKNPIEKFLAELVTKASATKGSGWVIAIFYRGNLQLISIDNHRLRDVVHGTPLLVVDAWEHAFYLDYQSEKKRFFNSIIELIDWDNFEIKLTAAHKSL